MLTKVSVSIVLKALPVLLLYSNLKVVKVKLQSENNIYNKSGLKIDASPGLA